MISFSYTPLLSASGGRWINNVTAYSHEKTSSRGHLTAQITFVEDDDDRIADWVTHGLGRYVSVSSRNSNEVFAGVVAKVNGTWNGGTEFSGDIREMGNRLRVAYRTIRWDIATPVGGDYAETAWKDVPLSQQQYGVLAYTISGGELDISQAIALRDNQSNQLAYPNRGETLSSGTDGTVRLEIVGIGAAYMNYPYWNVSETGYGSLAHKTRSMIASSPNAFHNIPVVGAISDIDFQVPLWENKGQYPLDILDNHLLQYEGDIVYGIWGKEFRMGLADKNSLIQLRDKRYWANSSEIPGEEIEPGMYAHSIRTGKAEFVRRVTFNWPDNVTINDSTISKSLNSLGLGGMR